MNRLSWATALGILAAIVLVHGQAPAHLRAQSSPSLTAAASPSPSAAPTLAPSPAPAQPAAATPAPTAGATEGPPVVFSETSGGGGPTNVVIVRNHQDSHLEVRGRIQLNHIPGPDVEPLNEAQAYGSCTGCDTFSVALQIDLIGRSVRTFMPQNYAIAINDHCTGCKTIARALQYVVQVDDPDQVPDDVRDLIQQMNAQLRAVALDQSITQADQAEAAVNSVIARFTTLALSLYDQRDQSTD